MPPTGNWRLISSDGQSIVLTGSTYTWTGLSPGTYTWQVRLTSGGCLSPASAPVVIYPMLAVSITAQTNVDCFGYSSGSATATATGGTPELTYSWNTDPVQTTATAVGLSPGIYTVTVMDATGCSKTATATITQPASELAASITHTDVDCSGNSTGSATVNVTGGTPSYTYSWNTNPVQTTATAIGMAAGTYDVTVTDAKGCMTKSTVTILQPATGLTIISQPISQVNCYGKQVTFSVTAGGGTLSYGYQWQSSPDGINWNNMINDANVTGATSDLLTINNIGVLGQNLNGTQYRAVISDENLCTITSDPALLTVNPLPGTSPIYHR